MGLFNSRNKEKSMTAPPETVKINDKEYRLADLSAEAKTQLTNLRVCDIELQRLRAQIAITETAKATYSRALEAVLPKDATN
jgi:hypothetical protein